MRKILRSSFLLLLLTQLAVAQNVTITPSGITPEQGGGGMQKLSYEEIQAISAPEVGDMVVDMTFKRPRIYDGSKWLLLNTNKDSGQPDYVAWDFGGNVSNCVVRDFHSDGNGNLYLVGNYSTQITIDDTTINANGFQDLFIAKLNSNGEKQWVRSAGRADESDYATSLAVDNAGNLYVAGSFERTISLGAHQITSTGRTDIFLTKLSPNGDFLWAKNYGRTSDDGSSFLEIDDNGNLYLSGLYNGIWQLGSFSITARGRLDIYLARFDNNGNITAFNSYGGEREDYLFDMKVQPQTGEVNIAGMFNSEGWIGARLVRPDDPRRIIHANFIARLESDGQLSGVFSFDITNSSASAYHTFLALNDRYELKFAGHFRGYARFGTGGTFEYESNEKGSQIFYGSVNTRTFGGIEWVKELGGLNHDYASALALDNNGNLYLGTSYNGSNPYGRGLNSFGDNDMGVLQFNNQGGLIWAESHGGLQHDELQFLNIDSSSTLYTIGRYTESSTIGVDKYSSNEYTPGTFILRRND